MVLMLKHCCCGCTLKTGSLIIAVVFAILSALFVLMFSLTAAETANSLYYMRLSLEMDMEESENSTEPPTEEEPPQNTTHHEDEDDLSQHYMPVEVRVTVLTLWMWLSILLVLVECGVLTISIFLMFAANKDNAQLVYAWVLGFAALSCCFLLLHFIIIGLLFYTSSSFVAVVLLVVSLTRTAGAAYSTLVGYSYHRQLVGTAVARRISRQDD